MPLAGTGCTPLRTKNRLLDVYKRQPESTVAALNILRAKGVQLYLATGLPPYHLHYLYKDLPFEFDGMVMMNGQYCRRCV